MEGAGNYNPIGLLRDSHNLTDKETYNETQGYSVW